MLAVADVEDCVELFEGEVLFGLSVLFPDNGNEHRGFGLTLVSGRRK